MANRITTATDDVTSLSAAVWNDEFDNIYTGTIDRSAGRWGNNDDIQVVFGSSQDAIMEWNTDQTSHSLIIGVGTTSNHLIVCQKGDEATDFGIANFTNPHIIAHSADASTGADWIGIAHDQTDGILVTGGGNINFNPAGSNKAILSTAGVLYIGDSADAGVTVGIVVNQGGADNVIQSFKSSDVAQPFTSIYETDTFGVMRKQNGATGGLSVQGLNAGGTGATAVGVNIAGYVTTNDTTHSAAGYGGVHILVHKTDASDGVTTNSANSNLLTIADSTATRIIFDAEGDAFQDAATGWTTYDDYDDVALLDKLDKTLDAGLREQWFDFLESNKSALSASKIVVFNEDGHHFVNRSKLQCLLVGAMRQLGARVEELERKLLHA